MGSEIRFLPVARQSGVIAAETTVEVELREFQKRLHAFCLSNRCPVFGERTWPRVEFPTDSTVAIRCNRQTIGEGGCLVLNHTVADIWSTQPGAGDALGGLLPGITFQW